MDGRLRAVGRGIRTIGRVVRVPRGTFLAAYNGNQREANSVVLDAPLPNAIRALLTERGTWETTASERLAILERNYTRDSDSAIARGPRQPTNLRSA